MEPAGNDAGLLHAVTPGYWNAPAETEAAFIDDWFKTGDIGWVEADGTESQIGRRT